MVDVHTLPDPHLRRCRRRRGDRRQAVVVATVAAGGGRLARRALRDDGPRRQCRGSRAAPGGSGRRAGRHRRPGRRSEHRIGARRRRRSATDSSARASPCNVWTSNGLSVDERSCTAPRRWTGRCSPRCTARTAETPICSTAPTAPPCSGSRGASSTSLASNVEHEALLLLLAERGGVACPAVRAVVALPDGSMVLAMEDVGGQRLDARAPTTSTTRMLDDVWRQVAALHRCRSEPRRAARRQRPRRRPPGRFELIDFGAGSAAATPEEQCDRSRRAARVPGIHRRSRVPRSRRRPRVIAADDLAAAMPYLQPLALSTATRRAPRSRRCKALRDAVAETTARDRCRSSGWSGSGRARSS